MFSRGWSREVALSLAVLTIGCSGTVSHSDGAGGGDEGGGDEGAGSGPDGGGADGEPICLAATEPCQVEGEGGECCDGLECGHTSLGQVCCGQDGASCATENGEDCCGDLECVNGTCGHAPVGGGHAVTVFPVRGPHNLGYEAPFHQAGQWSCDDAYSNSDFVAGDHLGNDIWAARNTPVAATADGTLVLTGFSDYSGNKVTIQTADGWEHFMCHMDHLAPGIANGVHVTAGQIVGYVGNTGTASNGVIHLHISVYPPGDYDAGVDPWPLLHAVEHGVCQ